jgi:hypothetical protein
MMGNYLGKGSAWFGLVQPNKPVRLLIGYGAHQKFLIHFQPITLGVGSSTRNSDHRQHDEGAQEMYSG